jgi:carotenoid 1,2-hydratase
VFSPYYAWSGYRAPEDHVAVNVALYAPGAKRWAMTERGHRRLHRDAASLTIGPSALRWDGGTLVATIDEVAAPVPARIRGTVRLTPLAMTPAAFDLDPAGRHRWRPIAPRAQIEVAMDNPAMRWSGTGYLDSNCGAEPLADGFADWDWSRAHRSRDTVVLYDGVRRDGSAFALALRIGDDGAVDHIAPPPRFRLAGSAWRMARGTRADAGSVAHVTRTWEDSPFYVRSALATRLLGEECAAVHESLSLDRFRMGIVRAMLPFRMPRRR